MVPAIAMIIPPAAIKFPRLAVDGFDNIFKPIINDPAAPSSQQAQMLMSI